MALMDLEPRLLLSVKVKLVDLLSSMRETYCESMFGELLNAMRENNYELCVLRADNGIPSFKRFIRVRKVIFHRRFE